MSLLIVISLNGCVSAHTVVSSVELNDLISYCEDIENELSVNTILLVSPEEQKLFFGMPVKDNISPILICYNNNTENNYGLNSDDIKIRLSEGLLVNGRAEETPRGDVGSSSSLISFVGGTALLGIVPGIFIAAIASQGEASASAQASIDMQNKQLQSGVLKSNTKRAGFLYIQDDNNYISENYINAAIETNLLMLPSKEVVVVKSELKIYN